MTVPMIRPEDGKTADVHPDEVENWRRFGWVVDEGHDVGKSDDSLPDNVTLRAAIKAATGKAPGPRTSREALIEQFNAIPKGDA